MMIGGSTAAPLLRDPPIDSRPWVSSSVDSRSLASGDGGEGADPTRDEGVGANPAGDGGEGRRWQQMEGSEGVATGGEGGIGTEWGRMLLPLLHYVGDWIFCTAASATVGGAKQQMHLSLCITLLDSVSLVGVFKSFLPDNLDCTGKEKLARRARK
jgi:hypothetical protein